jgi:hypothetical protein
MVVPANSEIPTGAKDLLQTLDELYGSPPDVSALRERVLSQLATGNYEL